MMRVVGITIATIAYFQAVLGALFAIEPTTQTGCHGGQSCLVQWLDDGQEPLLTAMGPCYVALFSGNQNLIQQIEPVDVSINHSLTFIPNPLAGPDSNTYYVEFTSVNSSNSSSPSLAYSQDFSLDQMKGSFDSPVPELTSTVPVPSSVLLAHPNPVSTSILFGTIPVSTSASTPTPSSSPSTPSFSASASSSTTATTPSPSNMATRQSLNLWVITLVGLLLSFLA